MNADLIDLLQRVQSGRATCMFAATKIEAEIDQLLDIIAGAARRLETIRETDKSGLQLDGDIACLRAAVNPERFNEECQPGESSYFRHDTPRTNPQVYEFTLSANPDYDGPYYHVEASFARTLERELALAKGDVRALENTIIVTVGGTDYEGNPTSRINFLQRLRILVEKESELSAARAEAGSHLKLIERLVDGIDRIGCATGVCCCGGDMDKHSFGDGHSPVDSGEYFMGPIIMEARAVMSRSAISKNVSPVATTTSPAKAAPRATPSADPEPRPSMPD